MLRTMQGTAHGMISLLRISSSLLSSVMTLAVQQTRQEEQWVPLICPLRNRLPCWPKSVNRAPLPPVPTNCYNGIVLPDPEHQLTARTFDVVTSARVAQKMGRGGSIPPTPVSGSLAGAASPPAPGSTSGGTKAKGGTKRKRSTSSYGASKRKKEMTINLKSNKASAQEGVAK